MTTLPFGSAVLMWRRHRGLTQAAVARLAGLTRPNLSAIERGQRDVTLRTIRSLAAALDVRPGALIDGVAPESEVLGSALPRAALDRIAQAVVQGVTPPNRREQALARALTTVAWSRLTLRRPRTQAGVGKRRAQTAWLWLRATYSPEVVDSLLQRIADWQARHDPAAD